MEKVELYNFSYLVWHKVEFMLLDILFKLKHYQFKAYQQYHLA